MKRKFSELMCIQGGVENNHVFTIGDVYPVCGWNNGLQLVYEDENGDAQTIILHSYGDDNGGGFHASVNNYNLRFAVV